MSFARNPARLHERTQTVTRRPGWRFLRPGDRVRAVGPPAAGADARAGGKAGTLAILRVRDVRVEPLSRLAADPRYAEEELPREGWPCWSLDDFLAAFLRTYRLPTAAIHVTRIEFEYEDEPPVT